MSQENSPAAFPRLLKASLSHQILTLIGSAFLCFEFVFLNLYFDLSWFSIDLRLFGIAAIILALLAAHFLLLLAESKLACRCCAFVLKGKPPVVYRKWLQLNADGIAFGRKQIRYDAIDELELTLLGNLVIKSRAICGAAAPSADKVLKLPFSAADFNTQEQFLAAVKQHKPELLMNKRLAKGRKAILQKGAQITSLVSSALMLLLLFDVGYSSFYYLDLLKNYYLADTDLLCHKPKEAQAHFKQAEELRTHPLPFSWVSAKFLKSSTVAAGIWEQRSHVLWLQGKHSEAIEDGLKALKESPTNLRYRLNQARMYVAENRIKEAQEQLEKLLEDHKHALMPRLYLLAIAKANGESQNLAKIYKDQLDICYEDTYEDEPHWPPGGDRFFTECFFSEDLRFLMDRLLGNKYEAPAANLKTD